MSLGVGVELIQRDIRPLPLHDLTIRREGKTEHWFLNIDMSDAVGDDLAGPAADPFIGKECYSVNNH